MWWTLTLVVVFVILWGFAWRSQTKLALGIFIGLFVGGAIAPVLGPYESANEVPLWLPPLPFVTVVVLLLVYGFLSWWILDVKAPKSPSEEPKS